LSRVDIRSALPYSALAGFDLTGNGSRNAQGLPVDMCRAPRETWLVATARGPRRCWKLVNAWRAVKNLAPIPAGQLQSSDYNRFDIR